MFQYVVSLLLLSLYSGSGAPTATDLSISLSKLASNCENPFLSAQITSKVNDCHALVPPYDEKKIQCMLFYDINKQLCVAVAASKLALTEDYTAKITKEQNVDDLCIAAKDWHFSDLGEVYKKYVSVVFNNSIRCARVCSVDNNDLINVESNFYCKYFKWGAEMLKTQVISAPTLSGTAVGAPVILPVNTDSVTNKPDTASVVVSALSGQDVKTPIVLAKPSLVDNSQKDLPVPETALSTSEKVNPAATGEENNPEMPIAEQPLINAGVSPEPEKPSSSDKVKVEPNSAVSADAIQKSQVDQTEPEKNQGKTSDDNKNENVKTEEKDAAPKEAKPALSPNSQVDKPNDIGDPDDYPNEIESDEVRPGISDNQGGDDGDDTVLGDVELKQDANKINTKNTIDSSLTQFNVNDISQKEYYPNDGFSEDDDHFFSFFLTAIIMVVLLYILYHNKSKVSKVIMGLIVEGRQTERRRTSRGHAYKRLDTLEQAMSANSAAPPSKIIY